MSSRKSNKSGSRKKTVLTNANTNNLDKLMPDNIKALKIAFNLMDEDGSGGISPDELRKICASLDANFTENEIDDLVNESDELGDDNLSFEEFALFMSSKIHSQKACMPYLKSVFALFDVQKEGLIGVPELKEMMNDNNAECTDQEILAMMHDAAGFNDM